MKLDDKLFLATVSIDAIHAAMNNNAPVCYLRCRDEIVYDIMRAVGVDWLLLLEPRETIKQKKPVYTLDCPFCFTSNAVIGEVFRLNRNFKRPSITIFDQDISWEYIEKMIVGLRVREMTDYAKRLTYLFVMRGDTLEHRFVGDSPFVRLDFPEWKHSRPDPRPDEKYDRTPYGQWVKDAANTTFRIRPEVNISLVRPKCCPHCGQRREA